MQRFRRVGNNCARFALIGFLCILGTFAAAQNDSEIFELNLHFVLAVTNDSDANRQRVDDAIRTQVSEAESYFNTSPALSITVTTEWREDAPEVEDGELVFETRGEQRRYMDKNFDVVARSKTDGHVPRADRRSLLRRVDRRCRRDR